MTPGLAALSVEHLRLEAFRNYAELSVEFGPGLNVLSGNNGAGKTNVLEAICLLALGRSPRMVRDSELVRHGAGGFSVQAVLAEHGSRGVTRHELRAAYQRAQGKRVQVDGQTLPRVIDLCGTLLAVYFSPDDLWMVKGGPAGRRQLLDRLLAQESPLYGDALLRYRQALAQRNQSLRDVRARRGGRAVLAIWEPQLVQYGAEILHRRAQALRQLAPLVVAGYARLAPAGEALQVLHQPGLPNAEQLGAEAGTSAWAEALEKALAGHVEADIGSGVTGIGPHRDDLVLQLAGRALRQYGSQGQQRSVVLALKFAEREYLAQQTGRLPVLLVDDVLSELDGVRRDALQERLQGEGQVFLTTADQSQGDKLPGAWCWRVHDGRITASRQG